MNFIALIENWPQKMMEIESNATARSASSGSMNPHPIGFLVALDAALRAAAAWLQLPLQVIRMVDKPEPTFCFPLYLSNIDLLSAFCCLHIFVCFPLVASCFQSIFSIIDAATLHDQNVFQLL